MNCLVINLDRREYLHPGTFGDGSDLHEFANVASLTLTALGLLLADLQPNQKDHPLCGRWANQRIVVAPADGKPGEHLPMKCQVAWRAQVGEDATYPSLYEFARACCTDISPAAVAMLASTPSVVSRTKQLGRAGALKNLPRISHELREYLAGVEPTGRDPNDDSVFDVE